MYRAIDSKEAQPAMMPLRTPLIAALAATAALAVGVPAASASTAPAYHFSLPTAFARYRGVPTAALSVPNVAAGACTTATGNEGQGRTGGNDNQVCLGAGLSFIGPSIGQISTVIGPTIITPAFVGTSIVAGGNVAVGP
jgi:hypothetical protein